MIVLDRTNRKNVYILIVLVILLILKPIIDCFLPPNETGILDQSILNISINGPFLEELAFRGVPWIIISSGLLVIVPPFRYLPLTSRSNNYPSIWGDYPTQMVVFRVIETILLVSSSIAFSLYHLSTWGSQTFLRYTVSGLVFGILFLRYGFNASFLWHGYGNFLSVLFYRWNIHDVFFWCVLVISFIPFVWIYEFQQEIIEKISSGFKKKAKVGFIVFIILIVIISFIFLSNQGNIPSTPTIILLGCLFLLSVGIFWETVFINPLITKTRKLKIV